MADKKKTGSGRMVALGGIGLIVLALVTGADGLGGIGLLCLVGGTMWAFVEGRRAA